MYFLKDFCVCEFFGLVYIVLIKRMERSIGVVIVVILDNFRDRVCLK